MKREPRTTVAGSRARKCVPSVFQVEMAFQEHRNSFTIIALTQCVPSVPSVHSKSKFVITFLKYTSFFSKSNLNLKHLEHIDTQLETLTLTHFLPISTWNTSWNTVGTQPLVTGTHTSFNRKSCIKSTTI
mgnify:CR=1 FL=1